MVKLRQNNLPKVTQLVNGRAGFKPSQFGPISRVLKYGAVLLLLRVLFLTNLNSDRSHLSPLLICCPLHNFTVYYLLWPPQSTKSKTSPQFVASRRFGARQLVHPYASAQALTDRS